MNKNQYNNFLYEKLENNVEPDTEDFYLAEIESKANKYDKCMLALNKIKDYINSKRIGSEYFGNEFYMKEATYGKDILQIIDEVLVGHNNE